MEVFILLYVGMGASTQYGTNISHSKSKNIISL